VVGRWRDTPAQKRLLKMASADGVGNGHDAEKRAVVGGGCGDRPSLVVCFSGSRRCGQWPRR
jgi:hypothetical protein